MTIYGKEAEKMLKENFAILVQENEGLKYCVERLGKNNEKLSKDFKKLERRLNKIIISQIEENKKYKQALEEIREITNECITDCMGSKCEGMEEIQNKINEALNDNEDVENA